MQSEEEGVCLLSRADIKVEIAAYWLATALCQVIVNVPSVTEIANQPVCVHEERPVFMIQKIAFSVLFP